MTFELIVPRLLWSDCPTVQEYWDAYSLCDPLELFPFRIRTTEAVTRLQRAEVAVRERRAASVHDLARKLRVAASAGSAYASMLLPSLRPQLRVIAVRLLDASDAAFLVALVGRRSAGSVGFDPENAEPPDELLLLVRCSLQLLPELSPWRTWLARDRARFLNGQLSRE